MQSGQQFTRNADNFYLQVELHAKALTFLLASTNEEEFYELRLIATPGELRGTLPSLGHFFFYLLKNYEHPKAFRIDPCARIHITVPLNPDKQITVVLPANRITRDTIIAEDFLLQESPEVEEVRGPSGVKSGNSQSLAPFFGKKKKRGSETYCLDLQEETPRSESLSASEAEREAARNRTVCEQAEIMLREGRTMREVKERLRLGNRTAWKMMQQFQKYRRIFTPEQAVLMRKNKQAKQTLQGLKQEHPQASSSELAGMLLKQGIERSQEYIEQWVRCNSGSLIYYEESHSPLCENQSALCE